LKPALEPITLARKPLEGTVAANVLKWHTGALNIDGFRVATTENLNGCAYAKDGSDRHDGAENWRYKREGGAGDFQQPEGRWPANLIHDGSEEVLVRFPESSGKGGDSGGAKGTREEVGKFGYSAAPIVRRNDSGSAARFFYCAKTSKTDRNEGLDDLPDAYMAASNQAQAQLKRGIIHEADSGVNTVKVAKNNHPTVKPTDLMRYLCRLITPPNGVILDPYMGSGSTGKAAMMENFQFIGIERDEKYFAICQERIHRAYVDSIDI
jgi:site-specific DNA-methyltransferase (adenine-specific)